jgi:IMP dehydrogenase
VPVCSDGGVLHDSHMAMALAFGADFLMLSRYFARFDESPSERLQVNGAQYKEYWGEGSAWARNAARYGQSTTLLFEEGVDGYVPYVGSLYDTVAVTLAKLKATMVSCGSTTLQEFRRDATAVEISQQSIEQNSAEALTRNYSQR